MNVGVSEGVQGKDSGGACPLRCSLKFLSFDSELRLRVSAKPSKSKPLCE